MPNGHAYCCIEAKKHNGKVTVYCHVFTSVSALKGDYLNETFNDLELSRASDEY